MKSFIKLLLCVAIFLLSSCKHGEKKEELYSLTYVVYYQPTSSDTITMLVKKEPYIVSTEGTNYISTSSFDCVISTTAPLKILTVKKIK